MAGPNMSIPTMDPGSIAPHLEHGADFIDHLLHIAAEVSVDESQTWVLAVDTAILTLTLLGAFFIIGGMTWNEYRGRGATTRMRLVQSLIMSDVIMGLVGIIGCTLTLNGKPLVAGTKECDGLGVVLVATLFTQHLWTLSLAAATFMILVHPLHYLTSWIEKYWYWSWLIVWIISFTVATIGYLVFGYGPSGGICFYQDNAGLYGELIQFLPRAIVFTCIAILYGKLYVFLKRPDKIRTGYSDTPSNGSISKLKGSWFNSRGSRLRRSGGGGDRSGGGIGGFLNRGAQRTVIVNDQSSRGSSHGEQTVEKEIVAPKPQRLEPRQEPRPMARTNRSSKNVPTADLPPWEHIELPAFQVDGERYGGAEYHGNEHRLWRDWGGFHARKKASQYASSLPSSQGTRVADPSPVASPTKAGFDNPLASPSHTLYEDKISPSVAYFDHRMLQADDGTSPSKEIKSLALSFGSEDTVPSITTTAAESTQAPITPTSSTSGKEKVSPGGRRSSELSGSSSLGDDDTTPRPTPLSVPTITQDTFDASRRTSVPDGTLPFRRASGFVLPTTVPSRSSTSTPRGSISGDIADLPRAYTPQTSTLRDVEKGDQSDADEDEDDEDAWDLMRMLQDEPDSTDKDPFAVQSRGAASDKVEYVPESMASYLNRKTALLMLWFPLGYVLLFSVSAIRIIWDFSGNPPLELRAISRWMMFGQGLLDALIYGVVEWHTKRVVRRRVRKGTFSPRTSHNSNGQGLASALRGLNSRGNASRPTSPRSEINPTASAIRRDGASPTVSFVDPEMSILQRLDVRKPSDGSGETIPEK